MCFPCGLVSVNNPTYFPLICHEHAPAKTVLQNVFPYLEMLTFVWPIPAHGRFIQEFVCLKMGGTQKFHSLPSFSPSARFCQDIPNFAAGHVRLDLPDHGYDGSRVGNSTRNHHWLIMTNSSWILTGVSRTSFFASWQSLAGKCGTPESTWLQYAKVEGLWNYIRANFKKQICAWVLYGFVGENSPNACFHFDQLADVNDGDQYGLSRIGCRRQAHFERVEFGLLTLWCCKYVHHSSAIICVVLIDMDQHNQPELFAQGLDR